MATRGTSRQRNAAQWRELIDRFSRSGLTRKAFCAREGIGESTLGAWQRRLRNTVYPTAPETGQEVGADRGLFAEFTLPGSMDGDRPAEQCTQPWDVELDLGDGMCLRIRRSRGC